MTQEELEAIASAGIMMGLLAGVVLGAGIWLITTVLDMIFEFVYGVYLRRKYRVSES